MTNLATSPRLLPGGIALGGAIFCIAAAIGSADELCLTQGCALYKDVDLLGLSLWWWGAGAFSALALLILAGALRPAFWGAFAALAADCVFVAWMAVSAPCVSCLVAGVLFLGVFLSLAVSTNMLRKPAVVLVCVWLFLFSPNLFAVGHELAGPWAIRGSQSARLHLFISPSCPACREAVTRLTADGESNLAFFPVAENEQDLSTILQLERELASGGPFARAFAASLDNPAPVQAGSLERLGLRLRLFRNKLYLGRMGAERIPVIVSHGLAQGSAPAPDRTQPSRPGGDALAPFSGSGSFSSCAGNGQEEEDCD